MLSKRYRRSRRPLLPALFGLLVLFSAGHGQSPNRGNVLRSDNGRFVFGQVSEQTKDQYMLDVQTGRLWRIILTPDTMKVLAPVPYLEIINNQPNYFYTPSTPLPKK
jgi:hypothetical protein